LGSRQKKKEAEFEQGVNIAIKSGNSEALRKMAKGKGFDAIRQTLDGLADTIDEKDEQAKVNRVIQLVQGGFAHKALAQAVSIGDGSLVADIATIQRAGQIKALQQSSASADTLRKEFTKQAEKFILIRDAYTRVQAAGQEPSPAGDMALIYNYMKLLDPTSTVMAGEYATAKDAGGAWLDDGTCCSSGVLDCHGNCNGDAVVDECGNCGGDCSLIDVLYNTDVDIAGFQFNVQPPGNVLGASGGAAEDAGFTVSASSSLVLGFSFTGSVILQGLVCLLFFK